MNGLTVLCGDCKWRDKDGYCQNPKLDDDYMVKDHERHDMLLCEYYESGRFWVGPKFGCVHGVIREKTMDKQTRRKDAK